MMCCGKILCLFRSNIHTAVHKLGLDYAYIITYTTPLNITSLTLPPYTPQPLSSPNPSITLLLTLIGRCYEYES